MLLPRSSRDLKKLVKRGKFEHVKSYITQSFLNRIKRVLYIREWHGRPFKVCRKSSTYRRRDLEIEVKVIFT